MSVPIKMAVRLDLFSRYSGQLAPAHQFDRDHPMCTACLFAGSRLTAAYHLPLWDGLSSINFIEFETVLG